MKYLVHSAFNPLSTPDDGKCAEVVLTVGEPEWQQTNTGQFNKVAKNETFRFITTLENLRKLSQQLNTVADEYEKIGEEV